MECLQETESIRKIKTKMASVLQPKNSGGPISKFWEASETVSALEHVKGWLCKHAKKVIKHICLFRMIYAQNWHDILTGRQILFLIACSKWSSYSKVLGTTCLSGDSISRRLFGQECEIAPIHSITGKWLLKWHLFNIYHRYLESVCCK